MFTLKSASLSVEVLDPVADRARMGARYCAGGYIFQVNDARHGTLLSGPTYPNDFNTFDGQGIPDAFNLAPLRKVGDADIAAVIGVGVIRQMANWRVNEPVSFCEWQIAAGADAIHMTTHQAHGDWSWQLTREVILRNRTLHTRIELHNDGNEAIGVRWFPHPFFPQPETPELMKINAPLRMPDNEGYALADNGFICRKRMPDLRGDYQSLAHEATAPLVILQRHPTFGQIAATCSYAPAMFPIWGNRNTFSWEPFFERSFAPRDTLSWWIDYDF
jgi:hypothetical protein